MAKMLPRRAPVRWALAVATLLAGMLAVSMPPVAVAQTADGDQYMFIEHRVLILTLPGWTLTDFLEVRPGTAAAGPAHWLAVPAG
jgi:hypothetical protein